MKTNSKISILVLSALGLLMTAFLVTFVADQTQKFSLQKQAAESSESPLAANVNVIEARGIVRVQNTKDQGPIEGAKIEVRVWSATDYSSAPCPPQEGSVNQTTTGRDGLFSFKCDLATYADDHPEKLPFGGILVKKTYLPDPYLEERDSPWCCDPARFQELCSEHTGDNCGVDRYDTVSFNSLDKSITGMITFYGRVALPSTTPTPTPSPPPTACNAPMDVVFIFDLSANMNTYDNILKEVDKLAPDIIDHIELASGPEKDYRVGIASFKKGQKIVNLKLDSYDKGELILKIRSVIMGFDPYDGRMQDPESSDLALKEVLENKNLFPWRDEAEKMIILITAVPPGGEDEVYVTGVDDLQAKALADEAARQNIRISSVLVDYQPIAKKIMNYYSLKTKGLFIQLKDGWQPGDADRLVKIIDNCGRADSLKKGCQEACDVEGNNYGECGWGLKCTNAVLLSNEPLSKSPGWCVNGDNHDSADCWYMPNSSLNCNEGRWYLNRLLIGKDQTIEFWVRPESRLPSSNAIVFQKCTVAGITVKIVTDSVGVSRFKLIFGKDNKVIESDPITANGYTWTHLAFTKTFKNSAPAGGGDLYDVRFYVNGQLQGVQRDAVYSTSVSDRCNMVFANKDDNFIREEGFNGNFQDFRFSEGVRNITSDWNAGYYRSCLTADNTTKILLNLDGNYQNFGTSKIGPIGFDRYRAWGENYSKGCRFDIGRQCSPTNIQPTPTWPIGPGPASGWPLDLDSLKLQGIKEKTEVISQVTLKQDGIVKVQENINLTSNDQGLFAGQLANLPTGAYELLIKPEGYLQKKTTIEIKEGQNQQGWQDKVFLVGDFDNNNVLNVLDLALILQQYTDLEVSITSQNQKYDINQDNILNIFDLALVLQNYTELEVEGER